MKFLGFVLAASNLLLIAAGTITIWDFWGGFAALAVLGIYVVSAIGLAAGHREQTRKVLAELSEIEAIIKKELK